MTYQMETLRQHENYRIEVIAEPVYFRSGRKTEHEYKMMEYKEVAAAIKRHVDSLDSVTLRFDTSEVCVHCHIPVEDGMTDDGPGCCDEAVEHYEAWKAAQP